MSGSLYYWIRSVCPFLPSVHLTECKGLNIHTFLWHFWLQSLGTNLMMWPRFNSIERKRVRSLLDMELWPRVSPWAVNPSRWTDKLWALGEAWMFSEEFGASLSFSPFTFHEGHVEWQPLLILAQTMQVWRPFFRNLDIHRSFSPEDLCEGLGISCAFTSWLWKAKGWSCTSRRQTPFLWPFAA